MTSARPTAASAAAIAMEKIAIITPVGWCGSRLKRQNAMKFKFAAASIISMPIKMKMAWRRLKAASSPMQNSAVDTMRKSWSVSVMARALPRRGFRASPLFLHHENKRADQCGGEQEPDALQRPNIIGHQDFTDALNSERRNCRRSDGGR